jgi:hypothetical protein
VGTSPVDAGWAVRRTLRGARSRWSRLAGRAVAAPAAPYVVLGLGMLVVAVATGLISARAVSHTFDEDLYKASAVHYAYDGLPDALIHDLFARGPARLYPLLISPLFKAFDADVAIRMAHVLGCLLFASAAIPAYLLARIVVRSPWAAVLAALGAIFVPWTALASSMYTENLAYPLFLWSVLAQWRAIERPSAVRDVLALATIVALVTTRTQFGILLPAYILAIFVRELAPARRREHWRFGPREGALRLAVAYPASLALGALVVLVLLWRAKGGQLHDDLARLLGGYSEIQDRRALGQQYATAVATEVVAFGFGTGIVAAVVGGAWYGRALAGRLGDTASCFAVHAAIVLGLLVPFTIYAQGGWLRNATEERYYVYVVPFLWIGTAAALERRVLTRAALGVSAAVVVLCVAAADLLDAFDDNYIFLAPVHAMLGHLVPLWLARVGERSQLLGSLNPLDFRVLLAFAAAAACVWAWGRGARVRGLAVAAALAVQVAFASYAWATIDGHVAGAPPRTGGGFAALGWIDRSTGGEHVRWLDNQDLHDPVAARNQQVDATFYNDVIRGFVTLPQLDRPVADPTLQGLPLLAAKLGGPSAAGVPGGLIVSAVDSPVLQVEGRVLGHSPDGRLELLRVAADPPALWSVTGLNADNSFTAGKTGRVRVGPGIRAVRLQLARPGNPGAKVSVDLGGRRRTRALDPGAQPLSWTVATCGAGGGTISGTAGALAAVRLVRGRC